MRAGRLRHRLTVQRPVETRDAYGGVTTAWETYATRWGAVIEQAGREALMGGQNTGELLVEIRLRHVEGLTPKMRISHDGRTYGIRAIMNPDRRNVESVCTCTHIMTDRAFWFLLESGADQILLESGDYLLKE